jgi:hypothetical protein
MAAIATKTTEKILAREAEGLVRQIKIELGKVRNEMKKSWDQTVALVKSPEMEKKIEEISNRAVEQGLAAQGGGGGGVNAEEIEGKIEEISERVAEEVSKDSLKGFLDELRTRVEEGIEGRLEEFVQSDKMREAVAAIAQTVMPAGGGGEGGGGGPSPEAIKKIVSDEIIRRTDEAFQDLVPKHVGKFLDEKLPPPEFFESLVTRTQVQQELDKRLKAGSGSARAASPGGPGESAIFANMIGRVLSSDELKELIDDKFRVINNYIKNELVPRAVKKELDKA